MSTIATNLQAVKSRVAAAAIASGRDAAGVALLAVSKTFSADAVCECAAAGHRAFGENYVQEAVDKIIALQALQLVWHFIGPIQGNKTRLADPHGIAFDPKTRLLYVANYGTERDEAAGTLQELGTPLNTLQYRKDQQRLPNWPARSTSMVPLENSRPSTSAR